MKKTIGSIATAAILSSLVAATGVTAAEYDTNGVINFTPDTSITLPIDPTNPDPEVPVSPIDPTDPEGPNPGTAGPLSIDFASSYAFGEQVISTLNKVYYADIQEFTGDTTGPNYVQVTDKRGTLEGWKLSVKQNGQFATADDDILTGAQITLKKGGVTSNLASDTSLIPGEVQSEVALKTTGEETVLVDAAVNQGAGTWIYRLGSNAEEGETGVELAVPGSTVKRAKEYRTTMTWILSSTPGN
ncbi:WxL domain-containing protein [Vagococcus sp. BWB3-3]|uniref:WxL domain-containing protein n=1 Tax=Vagococcus allomyrinae TaxID=2794353 RepID=A0A940P6Y9_9ENTE|nr:WxL domain-containing protein [Vagococcus allomyrinae]MBP1039609.1 WxL domain-containing protein [Vagococcus allomyrinae]